MAIRRALLGCATLVLSVLAVVGRPDLASAVTINVPTGVPTLQEALDVAAAGDTVVVAPGIYHENIDFRGKDITLRSAGGPASTTIMGITGSVVTLGPNGAIGGFTISGGNGTFGGGMSTKGAGSRVEGNVFDGNTGFEAAIGGNNASPSIVRNVFRNNSCDNQGLSGVVAFINESSPYVANNVFEDNPCRAVNMTLPVPAAPLVVNNTMVRNRVGVYVDTRTETFRHVYRNNVLVANDIGLEVAFGSTPTAPTFDHNVVFANGTNYVGIADLTGISGNLAADPRFSDVTGRDYHLTPGSPAIDTASEVGAPAVDFDGSPRPQDGNGDGQARTDIGAFELIPAPATTTTLPVTTTMATTTLPVGAACAQLGAAAERLRTEVARVRQLVTNPTALANLDRLAAGAAAQIAEARVRAGCPPT